MTRLGKVFLAAALFGVLLAPQAAKADTMQWEGINWFHLSGSAGSYVDASNNLVLTNGYQSFTNSSLAWGNWFEVSFIDPGNNVGGFYMEIFDGPRDMEVPRAWVGAYMDNSPSYRMFFEDKGPDYDAAGQSIPRTAGAHTFRIENYAGGLRFWIDGQLVDTLLHWDRLLQQSTYETLVGPLDSVQTVELWGNNVTLTGFSSGTSEAPVGGETPEPGTLLMFGSAAALFWVIRRRESWGQVKHLATAA